EIQFGYCTSRNASFSCLSLSCATPQRFHSGCTSLHSHQLCMSVPFSPHLLFLGLLILTTLTELEQAIVKCVWNHKRP
uniref:Uncharacterized protein n=1 Tax=Mustela putorius furo TaxID=9669 RepID=M3XPG2_MUSPF